ncbi:MAG: DUF3048 domain-containing protein [Eubacteriales bacterium]|jgi:hypothetical protein|nr:DUF3048 domain-containing protein [Eubacteriales bacterium]
MKYARLMLFLSLIVVIIAVFILTGCKKENLPSAAELTGTEAEIISEKNNNKDNDEETQTAEPVTEEVTEPAIEAEPLTEPPEETSAGETQKNEPADKDTDNIVKDMNKPAEPENGVKAERLTSGFINMLTGLPATKSEYYKRPAAIMINNIKISCPQIGISQADVIYECLVEGGTTRLLMFMLNYENASEIGSVRSSREYYLDFAANHDAVYVHAGGSNTAYVEIRDRRVDNLDGVNMYLPDAFYRDEWRKVNMGYEHSLMITGPRIAASVKYKKYRTDIKDTYNSPFNFVDYNGKKSEMTGGGEARHVIITYNNAHFPQYIYNSKTDTYKRYQFNGVPHIDGANDEQLEFTNVLILNLPHSYTGDAYGHVNVDTVGSGDGYYVSGGKYIPIVWTKKSKDIAMMLTNIDGSPLLMNCGKTFVNIVNQSAWNGLTLNYKRP